MKDEKMIEEKCENCLHYRACILNSEYVPTLCRIYEDRTNYRKQSEGEWVRVMNHKECSRCGYNAPYKKIKAGYHLQDLANFCPNCGAKMKGESE